MKPRLRPRARVARGTPLAAAGMALVLMVAACGNGDDGDDESGAEPTGGDADALA